MKSISSFSICSLLVLVMTSVYSQSPDSLSEKMDELIPSLMEDYKVPGLAISILESGKPILAKGYGYAHVQNEIPVSHRTGFNIGSISKLFTAFGVMILAEDGRIHLDEPIEKYISRWKLPISEFDHTKITVRSLLNHTGGISVHGYPGFTDKSALPTLENSLNGDNGPARDDEPVVVLIDPQTTFKYSGGGYTLLQLMIEEVTGLSFAAYMKEHLFGPLKMKNTSFIIGNEVLGNSATPYDDAYNPLPMEYFTAQAAAGLHTTLEDFMIFADHIINQNSIISESSLEEMIEPTETSKGNFGLGFRIMKMGPVTFKGHAGSNTGWQSAFFIDFKTKSGLIMLSNGDLGDDLLKTILRKWASLKYRR